MKRIQALKMRAAIQTIISLTDPAIEERLTATTFSPADNEVHLYLREPQKSGLVDLMLLAKAIEEMGTSFLAVESTYDAGTEKHKEIRNSVKIW